MFHVFHLGPLSLGRRRAWLVGAIDEFGGFVEPVLHKDLDRAVTLMIEGLGEEDVAVEPALAALARTRAVPVATRPAYLDDAPAVLAFNAVNAQEDLPRGTGIQTFLQTCREYGAVAPWDRYDTDQPIRITGTARNRETTREAVVLGADGEPCGLLLCDQPGTALRCVDALRRGDEAAVQRIDAITLAFSSDPAWALEAVRTAFSLPEFPCVFRTRRRQLCPTTEVELGALGVALGAVTLLCAGSATRHAPAESVLCIDGDEFRAVAFPPEPSPRPRDAPRLAAGGSRGPGVLH